MRLKCENVIVIGIVPSLDGEPKSLNEFLQPAVDELNALWKGVRLKSSLSSISLKFRAALLCVSADIPAARKLCGFKGHSAYLGCSRCLKVFPGGFGERKITLVLTEKAGKRAQTGSTGEMPKDLKDAKL